MQPSLNVVVELNEPHSLVAKVALHRTSRSAKTPLAIATWTSPLELICITVGG